MATQIKVREKETAAENKRRSDSRALSNRDRDAFLEIINADEKEPGKATLKALELYREVVIR